MLDLTFGEQVKIILSRKGMTIKELAEIIEKRTGKKMSRQNLTQRLGRDNFQEQDMRMIAEILGCPFRLSILSDSEAAEAEQSMDGEKAQPTTKELVRIAKAKARKEKKAKEAERLADAIDQIPSEIEREPNEKEMTLGDYIDIHEELERQETDRLPKVAQKNEESDDEELKREESEREETGEEPKEETEEAKEEAPQTTLTDPDTLAEIEQAILELKEMEKEVERDRMNAAKARERQQQEEKKVTGWRAMFQRRSKKEREEEALEEERIEQEILSEPDPDPELELIDIEDDFIDYSDSEEYEKQEETELENLEEDTEEYEESDEEEDLSKGERNPYTGHEYETNSVRMHPKRIGYVQLYDRGDHAWTDMTEWAFLGYQERKKALLGKDYEPPIYLD